ncbi:MAG: hypothetical protein GC168_12160 [Candidatus Hydrogenedens sp.]|nr:hypothetical protein [Candidatus Hydrogenedens sp.]
MVLVPAAVEGEAQPVPAPKAWIAPPGPESWDAVAARLASPFGEERAAALRSLELEVLREGSVDSESRAAWSAYLLGIEDRLAARLESEGEASAAADSIQDARRALLRMLRPIFRAEDATRMTPALRDAATRIDALAVLDGARDTAVTDYLKDRVLLGLPDERRDVIAALGNRDDATVSAFLIDFAHSSNNPDIVWACLESLSRMGVPPQRAGVSPASLTPEESRRFAACTLRAAQVLQRNGNCDSAVGLYQGFVSLTAPSYQVRAALLGLSACRYEGMAPLLLGYLADANLRDTVLTLLPDALDGETASALRETFDQLPPGSQASLLGLRARDGQSLADAAVLAQESPYPLVRFTAALEAGVAPDMADAYEMATRGPRPLRQSAFDAVFQLAESLPAEEAKPWLYQLLEDEAPSWARQRAIALIGERGDESDLERLASMQLPDAFGRSLTLAFDKLFIAHGDGDAAQASAAALMTRTTDWTEVNAVLAQARERGWAMEELLQRSGFPTHWTSDAGTVVDVGQLPMVWPKPPVESAPVPEPELPLVLEPATEGEPEGGGEPEALPARASLATEVTLPEWASVFVQVWPGDAFRLRVNGETKSLSEPDAISGGWSRAPAGLKPGRNRIELSTDAPPAEFALRIVLRDGAAVDLTRQRLPDDGLKGVGAGSPRVRAIIDTIP